jgi:regulator of protease activity HflC (stomatin/prohibitin superfamily)
VRLRYIQLPSTLKASIEAKQQAEQEALAMNFRLQKETQEAQRKRIEAQGIRDFQQIVAQGISPALLEWKGDRSHGESGQKLELQSGGDWEFEERTAAHSAAVGLLGRTGPKRLKSGPHRMDLGVRATFAGC